ncbi:shikimate dehydrogenase [Paenibacillus silvae]|uniref:Shikimate dehydrogenase (NADP(+)) n=1 Tax=Paenibacillus silvae TaxID=1325358 RepID=A0A2W6NLF4_9BACL|nr:shikimate dehydrogenase [Paenibacillus silvae]PZT56591.1 shikimate dehydrogenase [Paenibacillus silvae]
MGERITGKTKLIGLLGTPISHSLSPKMHNEAFAKLDLDYVYLAFDVGNEQLEQVIKGFRALQIRGCNVTMPNKTKVLQHLDQLSPAAELAGAVNTVVNDNGVLTGHITDGTGYMRALKEDGIDVIGQKMTIAGAGGAATAICIQAALDGVREISIFNQKDAFYERAQQTVQNITSKTNCQVRLFDLNDQVALRREIGDSAIFTNATSVGMKPLETFSLIEDPTMLRPELVVSDVVYIPQQSKLLKMAEKQGCRTINGLGMMLWQGARAFELWTGEEMPVEYIKQLLF